MLGKGGHASDPAKVKDPLAPAIDFHVGLRQLIKKHKDEGKHNFNISIPVLKTSDAINVVPD